MSEKLAGWGLKVGRFALKSWQVETESWQVGGPPIDSKIYRNPDTVSFFFSSKCFLYGWG